MEYMNLIPDEVETLIFKDLNYMDLKHYAQTSKARKNLVYRHLAPIAERARERFGLGPELSKQDIIERLYHVNGYTSSSFDKVTVDARGWHGPRGSIIKKPWRTPDDLFWYNISGQLHREDGPAQISYYRGYRSELWYINGKSHRIGGPASIAYYANGNVKSERWFRHDKAHRIGGPARINYYADGNVESERWYEDDTVHRIGDPAIIEYYVDGNVKSEMWYEHNRIHRIGGPASIHYYADGNVKSEKWF
jgi:hypothetical protein